MVNCWFINMLKVIEWSHVRAQKWRQKFSYSLQVHSVKSNKMNKHHLQLFILTVFLSASIINATLSIGKLRKINQVDKVMEGSTRVTMTNPSKKYLVYTISTSEDKTVEIEIKPTNSDKQGLFTVTVTSSILVSVSDENGGSKEVALDQKQYLDTDKSMKLSIPIKASTSNGKTIDFEINPPDGINQATMDIIVKFSALSTEESIGIIVGVVVGVVGGIAILAALFYLYVLKKQGAQKIDGKVLTAALQETPKEFFRLVGIAFNFSKEQVTNLLKKGLATVPR